jgi:hypothetical protein
MGIAEEEGCADEVEMQSTPVHFTFFPRYSNMGQFSEWKNAHTLSYSSVGSNESLSLSKMDDNLVEETARLSLVPVVTCRETVKASATDKVFAGETQQMSDKDRETRDMLIEKMEQHDALTQQLRSIKKQCTGVTEVCKKPLSSEAPNDFIVTLNDVENDFSLDEDSPDSPEIEVLNDDSLEATSSGFESSSENFQPLMPDTSATVDKSESCYFSRLISERDFISPMVKTVGNRDSMLSKSTFLGDLERQYGRRTVDQALAALGCLSSDAGITHNHEFDDSSFSAPARPPSPEFDIEMPEQSVSVPCNISYNNTGAEYSMISEADVCSEASLRDNGKEELNGNCADIRENVMVSADEDGGFLSVLSEAALYHATLKHTSDTGNNVRLVENMDMFSQDVSEELHCALASTAVQCVHEECDDVQKQDPSLEASGEFVQEGREQEESPGMDPRNKSVDADGDDSVSVIQEWSVLDGSIGSHVGSCIREKDATSDLNESDRKNIEDMKNLESCSEGEGFNDTLEEMEMLLKFGMDYMMSGNNTECPDATDKQSLCHSVSTPNKPLTEMSGFEDFGDAIRYTNCVETCSEDHTEVCTKREVCASGLLNKDSLPSSQGAACGGVETVSTSEVDGISSLKPITPLGKFDNKLQTVVSLTVNLKSDKPSPFKVPVKPVFYGTHIPKLCPPRSAKKIPLKPITMVSPSKRPLDYSKIVSPVGAYIHNTSSPSLVTTVKPKLCHAATPRRVMVGRGVTVMPRHDPVSGIEKTYLEVSINLLVQATPSLTI